MRGDATGLSTIYAISQRLERAVQLLLQQEADVKCKFNLTHCQFLNFMSESEDIREQIFSRLSICELWRIRRVSTVFPAFADEALRRLPMPTVVTNGSVAGTKCTIDALDVSRMQWIQLPRVQASRYDPALCRSGENLYVFGGSDDTDVLCSSEILEASKQEWTAGRPMQTARRGCHACALGDGRIIVIGGFDGSRAVANVEVYCTKEDSWTVLTSMPTARTSFAACLLPGANKIVVAGGFGDGRALSSVEEYDITNDSWSSLPNMLHERNGCAGCVTPSGNVIVAGGNGKGVALRSCEEFVRTTRSWRLFPCMQTERSNLSLRSIGQDMVALGGEGWVANSPRKGGHRVDLGLRSIGRVEVFDAGTEGWVATTPRKSGQRRASDFSA